MHNTQTDCTLLMPKVYFMTQICLAWVVKAISKLRKPSWICMNQRPNLSELVCWKLQNWITSLKPLKCLLGKVQRILHLLKSRPFGFQHSSEPGYDDTIEFSANFDPFSAINRKIFTQYWQLEFLENLWCGILDFPMEGKLLRGAHKSQL